MRIQRMGVLAVKIAQMYAVRSDLLPAEKCAQLARLLQNAQPLSRANFEFRWRALAPPPLLRELAHIDPEPIAAASLGQVHKASLRNGREVAIKILREDVRQQFLADLAKFRRWLKLALLVYPKLQRLADPLAALAAVEKQTITELDFLAEAAGASRLQRIIDQDSPRLPHLKRLRFPYYETSLSNDRVLVSEWIIGPTLAQLLDQRAVPYEVLLDLFRIHGHFLFIRGEFHGDLHPGNIIYRDQTFWFLDNANIETVSTQFTKSLFDMLSLIARGDLQAAAQTLVNLSTEPVTKSKSAAFIVAFTELYRNFAGTTVSQRSLTQQMMATVKLAVSHGIVFQSGAFPVIKTLMYLDGMVLRAAPNAILLNDVTKFASDFADAPQGV